MEDKLFLRLAAPLPAAAKQDFEIQMIKRAISNFRWLNDQFKDDGEIRNAQDTFRNRLLAKQEKMERDMRAMLVPVKHGIEIAPGN